MELSFKETETLFWVDICICKLFIIMELGLSFLISQRGDLLHDLDVFMAFNILHF